ncbi:MAG: RtcB family protein [Planctomycetes bacterium]|nr:RtcB family protein [Planctomycetota bacterium]
MTRVSFLVEIFLTDQAANGTDRSAPTARGVYVMAKGRTTLAEEAPWAYKDVTEVVKVMHNAGISRKVARLVPLGVVKG